MAIAVELKAATAAAISAFFTIHLHVDYVECVYRTRPSLAGPGCRHCSTDERHVHNGYMYMSHNQAGYAWQLIKSEPTRLPPCPPAPPPIPPGRCAGICYSAID